MYHLRGCCILQQLLSHCRRVHPRAYRNLTVTLAGIVPHFRDGFNWESASAVILPVFNLQLFLNFLLYLLTFPPGFRKV